jgi:hypothetical protein
MSRRFAALLANGCPPPNSTLLAAAKPEAAGEPVTDFPCLSER